MKAVKLFILFILILSGCNKTNVEEIVCKFDAPRRRKDKY